MTEYLDKWDGDIIRALRFQDDEICEMAADEIERLRAALRRIAHGPWPDEIDTPEEQCRFDENIARAALGEK